MNFTEAKQRKLELETEVERASELLAVFPKMANGLVPYSVRATAEFKMAKSNFSRAFAALQSFNAQYVKVFKKDIQAERKDQFNK